MCVALVGGTGLIIPPSGLKITSKQNHLISGVCAQKHSHFNSQSTVNRCHLHPIGFLARKNTEDTKHIV